jgi:AraC family transcriptional regulator of adaptative response/methylated-DNA-[protein]-cysteine methyltransferase
MSHSSFDRIGAALRYIEEHQVEQPSLEEVATAVGLSPSHFQRVFSRWVGISPKRFLQFLTVDHAKKALEQSRSVLDATWETGLSSPGRLHDLLVTLDAMTPGEVKRGGEGIEIAYGVHASPFGECLIGCTQRGVCWLSFHDSGNHDDGLRQLQETWPKAVLKEDDTRIRVYGARIFDKNRGGAEKPLPLLVRGTNFQVKVWEALIRIPTGSLCSYQELARRIGKPTAPRAVGSAVGANPISYLIPCHRVIRSLGTFGQYRWGAERKRAMVGWEMARHPLAAR